MDIALLVAGLPPEVLGGAETQAARTAALLAARHRVSVFTRSETVPPELRDLRGCTVIRRCAVTRAGLRFVADLVLSLLHLYRRRRAIQVIVAYQTVIDGLIAVLAGRLWSIPSLVWVRSEVEFRMTGSRQTRWLSPWVFRHATRIAVQSEALRGAMLAELHGSGRQSLARAVEAKLCVIGNGVYVPPPLPPGADGELLFVGRLAVDKGVAHLIAAMALCPQVRLTIVGEGAERERLEAAARGLANVRLVGRCAPEAMAELMATCAVLVLPSLRNEGLPNVVLEAMAAGRAVIATRHAGLPDLISDNVSGVLVAAGDVAALAAAITRLCADSALRARLGEGARASVARYAWPVIINTLEQELAGMCR